MTNTHISSFMFKAPRLQPVDYEGLKKIAHGSHAPDTVMVIDKLTERVDRRVPITEALIKYG